MNDPGSQVTPTDTLLSRGAVDCLPEGDLARKLALAQREGRPLRVKLGIDPTAPDIHLGHTVVLQRLRDFQDAGHTVVLIIGAYTARVGDPSGRSATRPVLSPQEIDANAATFQEQAFKILDRERVEVRRNGEWLDMAVDDLFKLIRTTTVAKILERDDFANRYAAHEPISILELLYPLLQAYDSVAVAADIEIGGTDQKFNLLLGRDIQRAYGMPEQAVMTMPILPGIDGERKMSKSLGNQIAVTDSAQEMFGKTLRLPDPAMTSWYQLLLGQSLPAKTEARDAKRGLARAIVTRFYGEESAESAEAHFDRLHVERQAPDDVEEARFEVVDGVVHMPALIAQTFDISRSEARRLLEQGGVKIDGESLGSDEQDLSPERLDGFVLQLGKRRFKRMRQSG